jgi:hypothetical protein
MTNYYNNIVELAKHTNIQPSEWDLMPFFQYQHMVNYIMNKNNNAEQENGQSIDSKSLMSSQKAMINNMSKSMKQPSFKMPKF